MIYSSHIVHKNNGLKSVFSFICLSSFIVDDKFPACLLLLLDLLIDKIAWLIYGICSSIGNDLMSLYILEFIYYYYYYIKKK